MNDDTRTVTVDTTVHDVEQDRTDAVKDDASKKKKHRKGSGIAVSRLIGTAIAAVSTSYVASRLTSTVNSLIALALISVISTLSIELYSRLLHNTKRIAAKTVAVIPYEKILPDTMSTSLSHSLEKAMEDTQEIPVVDDESDTEQDDVSVVKSDHGHNDKISKMMITVLLFVVVALFTIGTVAVTSSWFEKDNGTTTNVYPKTALSQSDTKKILDSAAQSADKKITDSQSSLNSQIKNLQSQITSLNTEITSLSKESSSGSTTSSASPSPTTTSPSTSSSSTTTTDDTTALNTKITDLQKKVDTLTTQLESLSSKVTALENTASASKGSTGGNNE
jgi:chaperonin cofactor prefoldin